MVSPSRRDKANALRALSMDAVQRAGSGHPGAPLGMADIAEVLWSDFLQHNPADPNWLNRDRFVLSNGHAAILLYAVLHLRGYDVSLDDLKALRQLHSNTPGHPEYGLTPGVETTTGPLGQGLANAVGMAVAEKTLAAQFNRPQHALIDHRTYVFLGDGCLMEGISHEACSLAATLKLGKLIAFYDDNGISIDGEVAGWFTDDTPQRFAAYGWHVVANVDGHDAAAVAAAIHSAQAEGQRPSLLCCQTTIGFGAPQKSGTAASHGAPLGAAEVARTRAALAWPHAEFVIPPEIYQAWEGRTAGQQRQAEWQQQLQRYQQAQPQLAAELARRCAGELPPNWAEESRRVIANTAAQAANIATRQASQKALEGFMPLLPELIGGSADLSSSNLSHCALSRALHQAADGNYIHFGVREFGMAAMLNGIALHGGFKPYGATFLMFSEYARNALRLAALMQQPCIFVFTHDSVGLGGDGPTHQPVEQLATLRLLPNLAVWRPCDAVETAVAWQQACEAQTQPCALVLSRQAVPHQPRRAAQLDAIKRGGYVLHDCAGAPQAIVLATGSEVALAMQAAARLTDYRLRVVSLPCTERFDAQSRAYQDAVLPPQVGQRIAIEAGVTAMWARYVGRQGLCIGIDTFGASAPGEQVLAHFGFTVESVVARVEEYLEASL